MKKIDSVFTIVNSKASRRLHVGPRLASLWVGGRNEKSYWLYYRDVLDVFVVEYVCSATTKFQFRYQNVWIRNPASRSG
ncbi:MAG: hypothetical protein K2X47_14085 [Bdellovibrionales bacterium]|nr:hypothetical protein [Bdellovibrionales bacterium]